MKMLNKSTIGIDISKEKIDVCILPKANNYIFKNDISGFEEFYKIAKKLDISMIIFEATGRYHRDLEEFLNEKGLEYCKINPTQAKRFGQALGKRAKTDKIDALMLAKMGLMLAPEATNSWNNNINDLQELLMAYRALIKDKVAITLRMQGLKSDLLIHQFKQRLEQIKSHISEIFNKMLELALQDKKLKRRFDILTSIPGIGEITALNLIIYMPELGSLNNKQVASLAGLAPHSRESGRWKGHSFIGGGRHLLRHALYMPILAACSWHNPIFKAKYQQLIAIGKPPKLAITAIMRKFITIANAMIKSDSSWKFSS